MRTIKQGLTVLGFALIILSFGASAWGVIKTALPNPEDVFTTLVDKAKGDKYTGTLTIFFVVTDPFAFDCGFTEKVELHMVLRLEHKKDLWGFSVTGPEHCYLDTAPHEIAAGDFITGTVIPVIAPGPAPESRWDFTKAKKLVQDGDGPGNSLGAPFFLMLDITLAVRD